MSYAFLIFNNYVINIVYWWLCVATYWYRLNTLRSLAWILRMLDDYLLWSHNSWAVALRKGGSPLWNFCTTLVFGVMEWKEYFWWNPWFSVLIWRQPLHQRYDRRCFWYSMTVEYTHTHTHTQMNNMCKRSFFSNYFF